METGIIKVTLEEAKKWYNSGNATLKNLALRAYYKKELELFDFTRIKTFDDALKSLGYRGYDMQKIEDYVKAISLYSKASAAMCKLNIIRKALNKEYNMGFTKDADGQKYIWYPYLRFATKDCTYYDLELKDGTLKKIGKITIEEVTYEVLYGGSSNGSNTGLCLFSSDNNIGVAIADLGLFGCATKEIADHFGEHFWTLMLEAMYGDMVDFEIVEK